MSENCFSRIASTGSFLPKRAVSNEELAQDLAKIGVETSDEWIRTRTGIEQRYLASGEESTTYLASEAAKQALASLELLNHFRIGQFLHHLYFQNHFSRPVP